MRYYKGYCEVINKLHKKYPNQYFENCASGGRRMDSSNCSDFDSYWLSDNQSPYEGMRLKIIEAGCKKIRITPHLGHLKMVKGAYPTPYWTIYIEHNCDNNKILSKISAPKEVEIIE